MHMELRLSFSTTRHFIGIAQLHPHWSQLCNYLYRYSHSSASDKLFADAAREEAEEQARAKQPSRLTALENEHENWDGDERIEDAVLRMLVDKYKPLRTGAIRSADQKLKLSPPGVRPSSQVIVKPMTPSTGSWATEPLLPSKEGHQPWHTTFKVPDHATSSIKYASLPPLPAQPTVPRSVPCDEKAKRKEREERKRLEHGVRLGRAKEATLDYRLGVRGSAEGPCGQMNPVSLKGWTSLVEDRIEKARKAGLFQNIRGRGKPLVASMDESNPFIAREEFLMNRIVQRNGAVPPWVEVQGGKCSTFRILPDLMVIPEELDNAVTTFREILRQSWIRRVVNMITSTTPPALLHTFTLDNIKAFRDPEWEQRERSYHQVALEEVNAIVRKYNGMAPYAVRRPYYIYNVEMERLFDDSAESIFSALKERIRTKDAKEQMPSAARAGVESSVVGIEGDGTQIWSLWDVFRGWLEFFLSKLRRHQRRI